MTQLWIVTSGAIGHAVVDTINPGRPVTACGRSDWAHARVIDRRPRRVCEACRAYVDAHAAEKQGSLFGEGAASC